MQRIALLSKILAAIGFTIAIGAWIFGVLGSNRAAAIFLFAIGFIIGVAGGCGAIIFTPTSGFKGISPIGIRVIAVGFAIAAIPTAVGSLLLGKPEDDLNVFFYTGGFIMVVGIVVHWFKITRAKP